MLRKKKPTAVALVPQAELSPQGVKLNMTMQILFLYLEPKIKAYRPFVETFLGIPLTPETLTSIISRQRSDSSTSALLNCVCAILKAAGDEQVSPEAFEDVLLHEVTAIREIGAEEVKTA